MFDRCSELFTPELARQIVLERLKRSSMRTQVKMLKMMMEMMKIFIRSLGVVDQLEEWRRDRLEELVVLIQKIWRG